MKFFFVFAFHASFLLLSWVAYENLPLFWGGPLAFQRVGSLFTADLRRQLANDHCNSLPFFFSLLVMTLPWLCGTSDERRATQPFFGCFVLLWIFWRRCGTSATVTQPCFESFFWQICTRNMAYNKHLFWQICTRNMAYNKHLGRQYFATILPCFFFWNCHFGVPKSPLLAPLKCSLEIATFGQN